MITELIAKYDRRKSFYHKAIVKLSVNGELNLYSYNQLVARLYQGKLTMVGPWDCSQTTRRHCKEFALQNDVYDQYLEAKNGK